MRGTRSLPALLIDLSLREWFDFAEAQFQILRARLRLGVRPRGSLLELRRMERESSASNGRGAARDGAVDARSEERLRRIADAIDRASRRGLFTPTCLVRAVAMERMMLRHGVPGGLVRVGVQMGSQGFAAHAWIEFDGVVVGDDPARVARFEPLADFSGLVA
jgi:hypothetical protein